MLTLEQYKNLKEWGLPDEECYRIPDLVELMEFARGLDTTWVLRPKRFKNMDGEWVDGWCLDLNSREQTWWGDSAVQAVYKLIERLKA